MTDDFGAVRFRSTPDPVQNRLGTGVVPAGSVFAVCFRGFVVKRREEDRQLLDHAAHEVLVDEMDGVGERNVVVVGQRAQLVVLL